MSVSSSAVTPVNAIRDILDGTPSTDWTLSDPAVYLWHERSERERGPGQDQPTELHCWMPTGTELNRLTADKKTLQENAAVEIHVMSLDEGETITYARDVIHVLSEYMGEQQQNTNYVDFQPSSVEDFREAKLAERTDHFVYVVECEVERITKVNQ
jgi:hypothetical protein